MISKDSNAKTVREQRGSSIFPRWVYHFESGDYRSPDWDETTYQSILKTQENTPVIVGKKDRRVWWLFRKNFYCEEEGHSADEVKALVTGNAQGTPKPNAPSIAPEVKQSETSSGQSPVSSIASGNTKLVKLTCPSCGGALELPDNLTVAHCMYCGTKILLDQEGVAHERRDLQRYIELCKVAVEAKNYKEAIEYCNRILEIDPENVDAWINKAVSTFWPLTTGAHDRYDEAMEYLTKASQIAPNDGRIDEARKGLTRAQVKWYNYLGNQQWELAMKIYNIYNQTYVTGGDHAKWRSGEHGMKAMDYWATALRYAPDNIAILNNIANGANFYGSIIKWNDEIQARIRSRELLRAKENALLRLSKLRQELQEAQSELAKLQAQSGFLVGIKINDVQNRIARLQSDIAKLEKDAAYDPSRTTK